MSDAPPITGVAEIVLSVANLPAMRQFYTDVLGFPLHSEICMESEIPNPHGEATISFLTIQPLNTPLGCRHPQLLVLIDYQRHVFARQRLKGHDVSRSTLNHLAFEIPPHAYADHLTRLQKLQLSPVETQFPDMLARAIFFRDPEDNVLELICRDPATLD
ncbi:MAG: VOC family protein [Planctomycetaceae bacterium]|nr:VOC family protein [Planctomycetaceae bacterium]